MDFTDLFRSWRFSSWRFRFRPDLLLFDFDFAGAVATDILLGNAETGQIINMKERSLSREKSDCAAGKLGFAGRRISGRVNATAREDDRGLSSAEEQGCRRT
jgi:hypothetical protein